MIDIYFVEGKRIFIGETYTRADCKPHKVYLKEGYLIREKTKEDFEKDTKKILEEYVKAEKQNLNFKKSDISLPKKVIDLKSFLKY
jgi:hypothetical protein